MNNLLKLLIAAACIVIIAGGAYWGWSLYAATKAQSDRTKYAEQRALCISAIGQDESQLRTASLVNCAKDGWLSAPELSAAGVGPQRMEIYKRTVTDAAFAARRAECLGTLRDLNMGAYKVRPAEQKCLADGYVTLADEQEAEKKYIGGLGP